MVLLTLSLEERPREARTQTSKEARVGISERSVTRLVLQVLEKWEKLDSGTASGRNCSCWSEEVLLE